MSAHANCLVTNSVVQRIPIYFSWTEIAAANTSNIRNNLLEIVFNIKTAYAV